MAIPQYFNFQTWESVGGGEEEMKLEDRKQKLTLTYIFLKKVHASQNDQGGFASAAAPKRALAAQEFALLTRNEQTSPHPDPLCFRYL